MMKVEVELFNFISLVKKTGLTAGTLTTFSSWLNKFAGQSGFFFISSEISETESIFSSFWSSTISLPLFKTSEDSTMVIVLLELGESQKLSSVHIFRDASFLRRSKFTLGTFFLHLIRTGLITCWLSRILNWLHPRLSHLCILFEDSESLSENISMKNLAFSKFLSSFCCCFNSSMTEIQNEQIVPFGSKLRIVSSGGKSTGGRVSFKEKSTLNLIGSTWSKL